MSDQLSFLSAESAESIPLEDGEITFYRSWLKPRQAEDYFKRLQSEIRWEQSVIQVYGKPCPIPRLNAWYGDPGMGYSYSGLTLEPLPWTPSLAKIRQLLEQQLGQSFNSVLANYYRDGRDSVSWHSDNEPELGTNPVIASVSLGGERRFVLKHRRRRDLQPISITLPAGSLLVMAGTTQHHWLHQVPKTTRHVLPRINLTYRRVKP